MRKYTLKEFKNYPNVGSLVDKLAMLRVVCKNCGKEFGSHYGIACPPPKKGTFVPDDRDVKTFHDGHVRLWDDLAQSGASNKSESDVWWDKRYEHLLTVKVRMTGCFACGEAMFRSNNSDDKSCLSCPIKWGKAKRLTKCYAKGTLFVKWCDATTIEKRKKYASQIRDLPWE